MPFANYFFRFADFNSMDFAGINDLPDFSMLWYTIIIKNKSFSSMYGTRAFPDKLRSFNTKIAGAGPVFE